MVSQIQIDRSSIDLDPLVIGTTPADLWWIPEDGFGRPGRTWARTYASAPDWNGSVPTSARLETSSIPLVVKVIGGTSAVVEQRLDILQRALSQAVYDITQIVDSVTETFVAEPADMAFGGYDSGEVRAFIRQVSLTIPVFPVAVT